MGRLFVLLVFLLLPMLSEAATTARPDAADYLLGPGDVVKISVYNHQDLLTEARISEGGKITFPLLGEVELGGLTARSAEKRITDGLKSGAFVLKPEVNLLVVQFHSQQVSVLGQVYKPGRYPIDSAAKLSDFLAQAGGILPTGADTMVLTRTRNGKPEKIGINQLDLFQSGMTELDLPLQDGDVIFVPRAPSFYIYGEVQRPGNYRLEQNMTLMQALSVGGGLTQRGTQRGMKLTRRNETGSLQTRGVAMSDMLQPDDVIYVSESLF